MDPAAPAPPPPPDEDDEEELREFEVEEIQKIVRDNIENCLGGNTYSHTKVNLWIQTITDKTLGQIHKMRKPFKYLFRITITQKNGAGIHTAASYFWDMEADSVCTVRWENKFMYCIVTLWGLLLV